MTFCMGKNICKRKNKIKSIPGLLSNKAHLSELVHSDEVGKKKHALV